MRKTLRKTLCVLLPGIGLIQEQWDICDHRAKNRVFILLSHVRKSPRHSYVIPGYGPLIPGDGPLIPGDGPLIPGNGPLIPGDDPLTRCQHSSFSVGRELSLCSCFVWLHTVSVQQIGRYKKLEHCIWCLSIFPRRYINYVLSNSQDQWPRGLKRGSTFAYLLAFRFRSPPKAWRPVSCECRVLSGRGL
jgi:hypothetical protein